MARLARVVLLNTPHHVTQRGNRRQDVFFCDQDYETYIDLIATHAKKSRTQILAYCLMPNHVHFVMTPCDSDGLRATLGEAHRRYTRHINHGKSWQGHLWQGRFHSCPMDEAHTLMAMRYVELNPVAAGLVKHPPDWRWSSAAAHLNNRHDHLIDSHAAHALIDDWAAYLDEGMAAAECKRIETHLRTGRPLGDDHFITQAERLLQRPLRKQPAGRKRLETGAGAGSK